MNPTPSQPMPEPPEGKPFRSVAIWPNGIESDDWHETYAHATAVCGMLHRDGFGGEGKMFPVSTDVEDHSATCTPAPEAVAGEPDPVEELAQALAWELEEANLKPNDLVTVNREKLKAIARRILAKAPTPPVEADKDAENQITEVIGFLWGLKQDVLANYVQSTCDELTTARATIAERDKRIAELEETCGGMTAKQRFDQLMQTRDELLRAGHNFGLACTHDYAKAVVDELIEARAALAHAAEVKEQA